MVSMISRLRLDLALISTVSDFIQTRKYPTHFCVTSTTGTMLHIVLSHYLIRSLTTCLRISAISRLRFH